MFNVRGELRKDEFKFELLERTRHINDRLWRLKKGMDLDNVGKRNVYKIFVVDRGDERGLEIHLLCHNATVIVVSYDSYKLITILNEGVSRLKKRYGEFRLPKHIFECATRNSNKNKNKFKKDL